MGTGCGDVRDCARLHDLREAGSKSNSRDIVTHRYRDDAGRMSHAPCRSSRGQSARLRTRGAAANLRVLPRRANRRGVREDAHLLRERESGPRRKSDSRRHAIAFSQRDARRQEGSRVFIAMIDKCARFVVHGIDRERPRANIYVEPLTPQQIALALVSPLEELDPLEVWTMSP